MVSVYLADVLQKIERMMFLWVMIWLQKKKFVHFRVNQIISKYEEFVSSDIPDKLHDNVVAEIDVSQYKNMRDLNKKIKDTFVALITP